MKAWWTAAWAKMRASAGWILAGFILALSLFAALRDWRRKPAPPFTAPGDPAPKIDKEARDAHDAKAADVAATSAPDVVDGLPGEVRDAISAGGARVQDILDRYRVGGHDGGDKSRADPDG